MKRQKFTVESGLNLHFSLISVFKRITSILLYFCLCDLFNYYLPTLPFYLPYYFQAFGVNFLFMQVKVEQNHT